MSPGEGQAVCLSFRARDELTNHGLIFGWTGQTEKDCRDSQSRNFAASDAAVVRERERELESNVTEDDSDCGILCV